MERYTAVIIPLHQSYGHICLIAPGVHMYVCRENKAEQAALLRLSF